MLVSQFFAVTIQVGSRLARLVVETEVFFESLRYTSFLIALRILLFTLIAGRSHAADNRLNEKKALTMRSSNYIIRDSIGSLANLFPTYSTDGAFSNIFARPDNAFTSRSSKFDSILLLSF